MNEMDTFETAAIGDLNTEINRYQKDADQQESKAKADFVRMIHASLKKLHDLNDLTSTEKLAMKDKIVDKRV